LTKNKLNKRSKWNKRFKDPLHFWYCILEL